MRYKMPWNMYLCHFSSTKFHSRVYFTQFYYSSYSIKSFFFLVSLKCSSDMSLFYDDVDFIFFFLKKSNGNGV